MDLDLQQHFPQRCVGSLSGHVGVLGQHDGLGLVLSARVTDRKPRSDRKSALPSLRFAPYAADSHTRRSFPLPWGGWLPVDRSVWSQPNSGGPAGSRPAPAALTQQ